MGQRVGREVRCDAVVDQRGLYLSCDVVRTNSPPRRTCYRALFRAGMDEAACRQWHPLTLEASIREDRSMACWISIDGVLDSSDGGACSRRDSADEKRGDETRRKMSTVHSNRRHIPPFDV